MESVMSDCSMTDVTRQQPEIMSNKNCSSDLTAAAATAPPSASTAALAPPHPTTAEGNNNSLPKEVSYAELELLKKLEEQNR